jgi:hypothetical protein
VRFAEALLKILGHSLLSFWRSEESTATFTPLKRFSLPAGFFVPRGPLQQRS